MKIYRYVSQEELNLMNSAPEEMGREYCNTRESNTFYYEKGQKYLHFFKNKKDIDLLRTLYKGENRKFYICTFNAPRLYLAFHAGKGYYQDAHGYETIVAKEYAIQSRYFNPDWLCNVEEDDGQALDR